MAVLERFRWYKRQARSSSSINLFSAYDANIIGGLLLGTGMAITGACPGTVLVQISTGHSSSAFILAGGVLGGILYSKFHPNVRLIRPGNSSGGRLTFHDKLGISSNQGVLVFGTICLAILALATFLGPKAGRISLRSISGGLLIGASQGVSLLLTGKAIGVSVVYEEAGQYFWWLATPSAGFLSKRGPPPSYRALVFASGMLAGSWVLARSAPLSLDRTVEEISRLSAILGGMGMVFGARLAGGCTSGHGISGLAMLSVSSLITVVSMFIGGIGTATTMS